MSMYITGNWQQKLGANPFSFHTTINVFGVAANGNFTSRLRPSFRPFIVYYKKARHKRRKNYEPFAL